MNMSDILSAISEEREENVFEYSAEDLRKAVQVLNERHEFSVGDIVQWKPGLRIKKHPGEGSPAIVVEILDPPVKATEEVDNFAYNEDLDLKLGVFFDEDSFVTFLFPSARFMPWEDPKTEKEGKKRKLKVK